MLACGRRERLCGAGGFLRETPFSEIWRCHPAKGHIERMSARRRRVCGGWQPAIARDSVAPLRAFWQRVFFNFKPALVRPGGSISGGWEDPALPDGFSGGAGRSSHRNFRNGVKARGQARVSLGADVRVNAQVVRDGLPRLANVSTARFPSKCHPSAAIG